MSLIFRRRCQEQMCYSLYMMANVPLCVLYRSQRHIFEFQKVRLQSLGHHIPPHPPIDIVLRPERCDVSCFPAEYPLSRLSVDRIGDILQWDSHLFPRLESVGHHVSMVRASGFIGEQTSSSNVHCEAN